MPTYIGRWSKFEAKESGWHRFEIEVPGKQYPVKVDTKKQEFIDAMMAVRDTEGVAFEVTEKDSDKVNPNTGKPYVNRYLEGVNASPPAAQVAAAEKDVDWDEKDRRDLSSRAWAQAISLVSQYTWETPQTLHELWAHTQEIQRKIYADVTGEWGTRSPSWYPETFRNAEGGVDKPAPSDADAPPDLDF